MKKFVTFLCFFAIACAFVFAENTFKMSGAELELLETRRIPGYTLSPDPTWSESEQELKIIVGHKFVAFKFKINVTDHEKCIIARQQFCIRYTHPTFKHVKIYSTCVGIKRFLFNEKNMAISIGKDDWTLGDSVSSWTSNNVSILWLVFDVMSDIKQATLNISSPVFKDINLH